MDLHNRFPDIEHLYPKATADELNLGWSTDEKICLLSQEGEAFLLRINKAELHESKVLEFKNQQSLYEVAALKQRIPEPIANGLGDAGASTYTLLTWVEGKNANDIVPTLPIDKQYSIGLQAGTLLKHIHSLKAPNNLPSWEETYLHKINKYRTQYNACGLNLPDAALFLDTIERYKHLLKKRPQVWLHGDYHLINMLLTPEHELRIIDFNRSSYGDPWEEFNRLIWALESNAPAFAEGQIEAYFNAHIGGKIPLEFFPLLALYLSANVISALAWAAQFSEESIPIMQENAEHLLKAYDHFQSATPSFMRML